MKKSISVLILSSFVLFALAQNTSESGSGEDDFSHWSVTLEGGINFFDGDITQEPAGFWRSTRGLFSAGATVEYGFTPTVSFGLAYYYQDMKANNYKYNSGHMFTAIHHNLYPFLSINLLRVFNKNTTTRWGVWGNIGLGASYFNIDYDRNIGTLEDPKTAASDGNTAYQKSLEGFSLIVPVGINVEYNFSRSFALGLKYQYFITNRDDLEGLKDKSLGLNYNGVTNDFFSTATVALRWKFGAANKNHTRNMAWNEFEPNEALNIAKKATENAAVAVLAAKAVQEQGGDKAKEVDDLKKTIDDLWKDVDDLKKRLSNVDTNAPRDIHGKQMSAEAYNSIPAVFFDFNKFNLDEKALETVYYVAELLKQDQSRIVEIRGFSDYVGSDEYNKELSLKRAERVRDELINVYGINPDNVRVNGEGRVLEPASKYRPNRRAEFHFNK